MSESAYKLIGLRKLYVFSIAMKCSSITEAAKDLCMTQPAVSSTIRQIERYFDVKLFDIVGKKIKPTAAAEVLYDAWFPVRLAMDSLQRRMSELREGVSGEIRVVLVSSAKYFISKTIGEFLKRYPKVQFHCDIRRRETIISAIEKHEYDIGILTDPPQRHQNKNYFLAKNPLVFVASPKNPISKLKAVTLKQLCQENFICREPSAIISQYLFKLFNQNNLSIKILFEIDSTEAIKQSVMSNLGVALVPEISVKNEVKNGELCLIKIENISLENDWYSIINKHLIDSTLINNFFDCVKKELSNF